MPNPVIHPGQVLAAALFEQDWRLSELAQKLGVEPVLLADFMKTHADLTPDLACKIAALLGTSEEMWLNLQANFDAAEVVAQQAGSPVSVG